MITETTPAAMPPCFDRWCRRFDDLFNHPAQKKGFRHYLGGLLGESAHKKLISNGDRLSWRDLSQDTSLFD